MITISTNEFEQYKPRKTLKKKRTFGEWISHLYDKYELEIAWAFFGFTLAIGVAAVSFVIHLLSIAL